MDEIEEYLEQNLQDSKIKAGLKNVLKFFGPVVLDNIIKNHLHFVFDNKAKSSCFCYSLKIIINKIERKQQELILVHEIGHFLDYVQFDREGTKYKFASSDLKSKEHKIAELFRSKMKHSFSKSSYGGRTCELFARSLEEFYAIKNVWEQEFSRIDYNPRYVPFQDFKETVYPAVEEYLENLKKEIKMTYIQLKRKIECQYEGGDFNCRSKQLTSLEGCPEEIKGYFDCSSNYLTSLKGCPREIKGDFNCMFNKLTSLEGCPEKIAGGFWCAKNQITSLEGCPEKVGEGFYCFHNQLTSLKGCPEKIGGNFNCNENYLTSLEGCPKEIKGAFDCNSNRLTNLKNAPEKVDGNFNCSDNQLTSLEGGPEEIKGYFDCSNNRLTSLEGCPREISGNFNCRFNNLTSLEGCPREISGNFNCRFNNLTSLEGCPKVITGDFNCSSNRLTNLKDGPEKVGGDFNCSDNPDLVDISDLPPMCRNVDIRRCPKIKVFPKIENQLTFCNPNGWVRKRIKKWPFYEVVREDKWVIVVRNKSIGAFLLDNL